MRGSLSIFLGCLLLTIITVICAAGLTLVTSETNAAVPMSTNETSPDYSAQAADREAGNTFVSLIVLGLWAASLMLLLVTFAMAGLTFLF
jgi:hypothetical protein